MVSRTVVGRLREVLATCAERGESVAVRRTGDDRTLPSDARTLDAGLASLGATLGRVLADEPARQAAEA